MDVLMFQGLGMHGSEDAANDSIPTASRRKPLYAPFRTTTSRIQKPIMQSIPSPLPELNLVRNDPVATPE